MNELPIEGQNEYGIKKREIDNYGKVIPGATLNELEEMVALPYYEKLPPEVKEMVDKRIAALKKPSIISRFRARVTKLGLNPLTENKS